MNDFGDDDFLDFDDGFDDDDFWDFDDDFLDIFKPSPDCPQPDAASILSRFEPILMDALREGSRRTELDPVGWANALKVHRQFEEIFGTGTKIDLHPAFASAGVSLRLDEVRLGKEQLKKLKKMLGSTGAFSMMGLLDRRLDVSVVVGHVYKEAI